MFVLSSFLTLSSAWAMPCKVSGCGGDGKGGGCQYLGYIEPKAGQNYLIKTDDHFQITIQLTSGEYRISVADPLTQRIDRATARLAEKASELDVMLDREYPNHITKGWAVECSAGIPNGELNTPDLTTHESEFMSLFQSAL
jgi:hypothetical protein